MSWIIEKDGTFLTPKGEFSPDLMDAQHYRSFQIAERNATTDQQIIFYDAVLEKIRG
jgi:hypothetical protein